MEYTKGKRHIMDIVAERKALESKAPEMHKLLKQVKADLNIVGEVSHATLEKIISLLKSMKS